MCLEMKNGGREALPRIVHMSCKTPCARSSSNVRSYGRILVQWFLLIRNYTHMMKTFGKCFGNSTINYANPTQPPSDCYLAEVLNACSRRRKESLKSLQRQAPIGFYVHAVASSLTLG